MKIVSLQLHCAAKLLGSEPNQIVALSQQIRFLASAWRTWRGQWDIYSG